MKGIDPVLVAAGNKIIGEKTLGESVGLGPELGIGLEQLTRIIGEGGSYILVV